MIIKQLKSSSGIINQLVCPMIDFVNGDLPFLMEITLDCSLFDSADFTFTMIFYSVLKCIEGRV